MSVAFYWCHTEGCPNYGRARKMNTADSNWCGFCMKPMHIAAPDELPAIVHEVPDEQEELGL